MRPKCVRGQGVRGTDTETTTGSTRQPEAVPTKAGLYRNEQRSLHRPLESRTGPVFSSPLQSGGQGLKNTTSQKATFIRAPKMPSHTEDLMCGSGAVDSYWAPLKNEYAACLIMHYTHSCKIGSHKDPRLCTSRQTTQC